MLPAAIDEVIEVSLQVTHQPVDLDGHQVTLLGHRPGLALRDGEVAGGLEARMERCAAWRVRGLLLVHGGDLLSA
jgi:hypothetical protein